MMITISIHYSGRILPDNFFGLATNALNVRNNNNNC